VEKLTEAACWSLDKGKFNGQDLSVAGLRPALAAGVGVSDFAFYPDAAKTIVDREMKLRKRLTAISPTRRMPK